MKLIIVKLGGSIITDKKSRSPKPDLYTIRNLSIQISKLHQQGYKLIVIHGAGSYAHNLAKKFKINEGLKNTESVKGFTTIISSMMDLNKIVTDNMLNLKIPVISLPPHSFILQNNKQIIDFDLKLIKNLIEKDLVPVLYGDVVNDTTLGCSIISGDSIVAYLSKKLNPTKTVFLSDVNGVYDSNPKVNLNAKLITNINNDNLKLVLKGFSPHNKQDVTGEMAGKILALKKYLNNQEIIIASGLIQNNLLNIIQEGGIGTTINF